MLKIGLTGGIGSGKTTVAQIFSVLGVDVYYADIVAKSLMNSDEKLKSSIAELIGKESYFKGILNNKYVASRVFNDPVLLSKLNLLVHPAVRYDFLNWVEEHKNKDYILQEAAILFESGFYKDFDYVVLVTASKELRIRRVAERDKLNRQDIELRMDRQKSEEEKIRLSDFIINNEANNMLISQVMELHNKFVSLQNK